MTPDERDRELDRLRAKLTASDRRDGYEGRRVAIQARIDEIEAEAVDG